MKEQIRTNKVKVFIRTLEHTPIFDRTKPVRVEAWYVGRYKKAIVCIRYNDEKLDRNKANGFVSFEVSTGRVLLRDDNFERLKKRSLQMVKQNYKNIEPVIARMAPLYGIGCFVIDGHEILGNTLIDKKVYSLCLKRTNGRYKEIADKIFS